MGQPGALRDGPGDADLIDLLHDSSVVVPEVGGAGDVEDGAFGGHGVEQAGERVGVAGGGYSDNAEGPGHAGPSLRHVDRGLLVAAVDEPEAFVVEHVEEGEDVVARDGKDGVDALDPEGFRDDLGSVDGQGGALRAEGGCPGSVSDASSRAAGRATAGGSRRTYATIDRPGRDG